MNYHALVFAAVVCEISNASVAAFTKTLEPFASGKIMPNFLNGDEGVERDRAAHPGLK